MNSNSQKSISARVGHASQSETPVSDSDALSQGWRPAERVVLDLDLPHVAIARALKRSNDADIWREYERARDQDAFLDYLAPLAGAYVTQQTHFRDPTRTTEWHHVLIAIPFLCPASSWPVAAPSTPDRAGASSLMGELQLWAGHDQPARLVLGCVKYLDLVRWSPVTQQDYLRLLAGEGTAVSAAVDGVPAQIPDGAVQLAFAIGSVRCWKTHPQLPGVSDAADWELRVRMAACLSYMQQCDVQPKHVLSPAPLADAVLAGLRSWVRELTARQHVARWDVRLGLKDLVYHELTSHGDDVQTLMLPMRRHQVGADGVSALTSDLAVRFGARALTSGPANTKGACFIQ
jgi:hypothetical protein